MKDLKRHSNNFGFYNAGWRILSRGGPCLAVVSRTDGGEKGGAWRAAMMLFAVT